MNAKIQKKNAVYANTLNRGKAVAANSQTCFALDLHSLKADEEEKEN